MGLGIPKSKIEKYYIEYPFIVRDHWLKNFSEFLERLEIRGSVGEVGVYKGDFAQHINKCFPKDTLYLFDTFEGFDKKDIIIEHSMGLSAGEIGQFGDTSEELVVKKLKYPENVVIVRGLFPNSAINNNINCKFKFVNLDVDLYQPTIEGLRFFSDKMVKYGTILVHDYFTHYKGIERAIHEFLLERKELQAIPIGDEMSIAIIGFHE